MFPVVEKVETGSNFQYLIFHFSIQSILIDIFEVANPVKHPVGENIPIHLSTKRKYSKYLLNIC